MKPDLFDACANIRMGTALFAKVYRIVTKWYGNPVEEAFADAVIAWQTGFFEGTAVFHAPDPGKVELATPKSEELQPEVDENANQTEGRLEAPEGQPDGHDEQADPNKAGIRVDLSGIGARRP